MARRQADRPAGLGALLVTALLAAGSCTASVPSHSVLLHPMPPAEAGYSLAKGGLAFRDDSWGLTVHPVDWRLAGEVRRDGTESGRVLDNSRHLFFDLVISNLSSEPRVFDPAQATASDDKGGSLRPAGFTEVAPLTLSEAGTAGRSPFRIFLPPRPGSLPPGTIWRCTLVFEAPRNNPDRVILTVPVARPAGRERPLRFVMEAFPGPSADRK